MIYDKTESTASNLQQQQQNQNNNSTNLNDLQSQNNSDGSTPLSHEGNISQNSNLDGDNQNLADMCLILANLKHVRDVLKGILPVSSLGQLSS